MKKMQFEFTDPAEQQAPQIPPGAGVPPAGMQGAQMPAGMQSGPEQGQPQAPAGGLWGSMAGGADQMGQGGMSSMLSDDQLAAMGNDDQGMNPIDLEADSMEGQLGEDPEMQMRMMQAARRMGGF